MTPIVLCCFGRGGSSMVWNFMGASPSVLMMANEWHQSALAGLPPVQKAARTLYRKGLLSPTGSLLQALQAPFAGMARDRVMAALEDGEAEAKQNAPYVAVKLMDYHQLFLPMIERGFGQVKPIILIRDPLAQCEGLMRSGLGLEAACQWYVNVVELMSLVRSRFGAPVVRFEDLLADPQCFAADLQNALGIPPRADGGLRVKEKGYGAERQGNTDMGRGHRWLASAELRGFVDPEVNVKAVARLSPEEAETIRRRTGKIAATFGY